MSIKILSWSGRLGNNIIQLKNAILIGLYYNFEEILFPDHKFFNNTRIDLSIYKETSKKTDEQFDIFCSGDSNVFTHPGSNNFFYHEKIEGINLSCFKENISIMKQLLRDLFVIKYSSYSPLENDELVIHIRSGDIFREGNVHGSYVMPPLNYYKNIIENDKNTYKTIYLIAEDKKNPVILELCRLYSNIQFEIKTLEQDIEFILRARNIILSYGTFVPCLLLLTNYTRNIYKPSYGMIYTDFLDEYIFETNITTINLDNYRKIMGKWCNTPEQRELMISYKL
jgi:hypothetical protein